MKGKSVSGMNYYACLSMLSLLILTPFAIAVEGPQMWALGFQKAVSQIGPQIIWYDITLHLSFYLPLYFLVLGMYHSMWIMQDSAQQWEKNKKNYV